LIIKKGRKLWGFATIALGGNRQVGVVFATQGKGLREDER